jgi:hypothetical protein
MLLLDERESDLVLRILSNALGDLRMTIADTENYAWRQDMKKDEELLKTLIARLERETSLAGRRTEL